MDKTKISCKKIKYVEISKLKQHPRNYRSHPDDQIEHLVQSIREHGLYRNIVIACDLTILAGHGVVEAARRIGMESIPVICLDIEPDDIRALKILAGDNEIAHLGERDDRIFTEMLREIADTDMDGLLGTGYDEQMLANLVMITRPQSEIKDFDTAAEWVGMPEFTPHNIPDRIIVSFRNDEDREAFIKKFDIEIVKHGEINWYAWWPPQDRRDLESLRFEEE